MKHVKAKAPSRDVPSALNKVILRRIEELGVTKKAVADALWINRVNFYYRTTGKVGWTFLEVVSLSEILRMSVTELVRQAERQAKEDGKVRTPQSRG
jgi:hypothetical protein